jgi:hypothetical protein
MEQHFLYADTSIIVTNPEYDDYKLTMTRIFTRLIHGLESIC